MPTGLQMIGSQESPFDRSRALLGETAMNRLACSRILVVGLGGVGGWCAEALARTGVGHLTLVDEDRIAPSNLNRQCPAVAATVGMAKADVMRERILAINPLADVVSECRRCTADDDFMALVGYDAVVDAIDSVDCKAALILGAFDAGVKVFSSMGAAFRLDPTRVRISRFEKVSGDGLAKALRGRFRRIGRHPGRFDCVWSEELPAPGAGNGGKGSVMQVTATFGMCLASAVVNALIQSAD